MNLLWPDISVSLYETGIIRWPARLRELPQQAWYAPHHDLWIIWAGSGRVRMRQGWTQVRRGMCLWRQPGHAFQAEQNRDDPIGLSYMHFRLFDEHGKDILHDQDLKQIPEVFYPTDPKLAESIGRRIPVLLQGSGVNRWGSAEASEGKEKAGRKLKKESKKSPTPQARQIACTLFKGLLMDLLAQSEKLDPSRFPGADTRYAMVIQLAQQIVDRPEKEFSLKGMADVCGYSPDHFRKVFKQIVGRSPNDFIVHWRIEMAKRLLLESHLTIDQIAHALGYVHATFFTRQFKDRLHQSPLQFRQQQTTQRM